MKIYAFHGSPSNAPFVSITADAINYGPGWSATTPSLMVSDPALARRLAAELLAAAAELWPEDDQSGDDDDDDKGMK